MDTVKQVKSYLLALQKDICSQISSIDGVQFRNDDWTSSLGTGSSHILTDGNIIEKGGINFSHVQGDKLPASATETRPELANQPFQALGVSLVLHPRNPFVPTTHMNVRMFAATDKNGENVWWFGGGYDLTPYYPFEEDCLHWHKTAKAACDPWGENLYRELSQRCQKYFFIKHRNEPRGIGGIFFDDLNCWGFDSSFAFLQSIGSSFCPAYMPIVSARHNMPYEQRHVDFQHIRRGRYVEFNLIYDRGTLFGLQSGGRTESILMSLPKHVQWRYDWHAEEGSQEQRLVDDYLKRTWL